MKFATGALLMGALCFTGLAVTAPLAMYTVTLAAFGAPHILNELRFVDRRFGRRLERSYLWPIAAFLLVTVCFRTAVVFELLPFALGVSGELIGVTLLALSCARGSGARRLLSVLVAAAIGGATLLSPYATAVSLAILHNFTPLGLLWQIIPRTDRRRVMGWALCGFIGLPLLVASGWPRHILQGIAGPLAWWDPLHADGLGKQLPVYVLPQFLASSSAVDLFTAAVVAQGAHYLSVILILPQILKRVDPRAEGLIAWPRPSIFAMGCAAIGIIGLVVFYDRFAETRALYSIFSSIHAWLEIPVLILALSGAAQFCSQRPSAQDAELQMSETTSARPIRRWAIQPMRHPSTSTTAVSKVISAGQYEKRS